MGRRKRSRCVKKLLYHDNNWLQIRPEPGLVAARKESVFGRSLSLTSSSMAGNRRAAAYEDIFGRPPAQHHRPANVSPPPLQYSPSHVQRTPALNGQQHYQYQPAYQQHHHPQQDGGRRSYTPSVSSSLNTSSYPQHYTPPHMYAQPPFRNQLAPPQEHPPARSVASAQGIIVPQPEQPPDASLEALTRQGLTPAQAYQAQVYLNSPAAQQSNLTLYRASSPAPDPSSSPANVQSHYIDPEATMPRIDGEDGVLGIDFEGDSSQEGG
jgi:RHO1 GDP-GTP exchange protein 1/2